MSELVRREYDGQSIVGVLTTEARFRLVKGVWVAGELSSQDRADIEVWASIPSAEETARAKARAVSADALDAILSASTPDEFIEAYKRKSAADAVLLEDLPCSDGARQFVADDVEAVAAEKA